MERHDFQKDQPIYWLNRFHERIPGAVIEVYSNSLKVKIVEGGKEKVFRCSPTRLEHREE